MKKISMILILMGLNQAILAQVSDSTEKTSPPVTITGSVDAYYRYNFNNPKTAPYEINR